MPILTLKGNQDTCVLKATEILQKGGVVIYPTDTVYGLGADAFSDSAVDRAYRIKERDAQKPMHAIFTDLEMVEQYAELNDTARKLAQKFLPGPLTLIVKKRKGIETGIGRGIETIGIRIPDNSFCIALAHAFGKPYTTTSANLAGSATASSVPEIVEQLGAKKELIDLAIDAGLPLTRAPSTVVSVVGDKAVVLRQGALLSQEIEMFLDSN